MTMRRNLKTLLLLPGDGIGPEVTAEVRRVAAWLSANAGLELEIDERPFGGPAYDQHGTPLTDEAAATALASDAVLMGAVGGPQVGRRAAQAAPGGGPAAPAQGHGRVRQPAPGPVLRRPGRRLHASSARWSPGSTS